MDFLKGEKKEIRIKIISTKNQVFKVRNALFELRKNDGTIEQSGEAVIEDHEICVLISPENIGYYNLYFTYEIANEILKSCVRICVR